MTIIQMIEQCSRAPLEIEKDKAQIHAAALAAAITQVHKQGNGDKGSSNACYNCSHTGHLRKHCPLHLAKQQQNTNTNPTSTSFVGTCR